MGIRDDVPDIYRAIGAQLRIARRSAGKLKDGIPSKEVASELGLNVETVTRWERGTVPISIEMLFKIARLYNKPLEFFLVGTTAAPVVITASKTTDMDLVHKEVDYYREKGVPVEVRMN